MVTQGVWLLAWRSLRRGEVGGGPGQEEALELGPAADPEPSGQEVRPGLEGGPGSPRSRGPSGVCAGWSRCRLYAQTLQLWRKQKAMWRVDISL